MPRSVRSLPGPGMIACGVEDPSLSDLVKPIQNSHGIIRSVLELVVLVLIQVEAQACSLWYGDLVIFSVGLRVLQNKHGKISSVLGGSLHPKQKPKLVT